MEEPRSVTYKQECPRCGERANVEGERTYSEGGVAWQRITCLECGCVYVEVYEYKQTEVWDEEES